MYAFSKEKKRSFLFDVVMVNESCFYLNNGRAARVSMTIISLNTEDVKRNGITFHFKLNVWATMFLLHFFFPIGDKSLLSSAY